MIQYIKIGMLHPHPQNPRKNVGDVTELADSIKAQGILQNLTVVPMALVDAVAAEKYGEGHYAVVIGNRRLAASMLAGLEELPCAVKDMPLREQIATMLLENIQRNDLTVLEQADGFQMMLDLGDTVTSIAEKTGFSDETVKHRIRLMELKRDKLEAAVARGGTIQDYIALEKINDSKLKNMVLESIGTNNFGLKLAQAIEEEKKEKRKEKLIKFFEGWAEKVKSQPDKTEQVKYFYDFEMNGFNKPEKTDGIEYYYTIANYAVTLYKTAVAPKKKKKSEAEKSYSKREAELKKLSKLAYDLRYTFVKEYSAAKKHSAEIYNLVLRRLMQYSNADLNNILLLLDIEKPEGEDYKSEVQDAKRALIFEKYHKQPEKTMLIVAYVCCNDSSSNDYFCAQSWNLTIMHETNRNLDVLYDDLIALGYEMSDEEKQLKDGTHELFITREKKQESEGQSETEQDDEPDYSNAE